MKTKYEDFTDVVGWYDGHPITRTCTAEEQAEAVSAGIPLQDFLDWYFTPAQDWQQDC
jgi:hypothetical protein